jgi:hypothetical protein
MHSAGAAKRAARRPDSKRLWALDRSTEALLTIAACGAAVFLGYRQRDALGIVPAEGVGYALGIVGLALMTLLLLYSLRKRVPALRSVGSLPGWFRSHMVLGIVGPTAILFHANFQVESLNARVALYAMLTVAASGFFGRFIYTRVHRGLYGQRETLRELRVKATESRALLDTSLGGFAAAHAEVARFEAGALRLGRSFVARIADAFVVPVRARFVERRALVLLRQGAGGDARWLPEAEALLRAHLRAVSRAASFELWETIFSAWHTLHFPLTAALFLAAAIHVLAVHAY